MYVLGSVHVPVQFALAFGRCQSQSKSECTNFALASGAAFTAVDDFALLASS